MAGEGKHVRNFVALEVLFVECFSICVHGKASREHGVWRLDCGKYIITVIVTLIASF